MTQRTTIGRNACYAIQTIVSRCGARNIGDSRSLVILQQWCWSRLSPGRPMDQGSNPPNWGDPEHLGCPASGAQWCCRQLYPLPHNACVAFYRNLLDHVQKNEVTWEPYNALIMSTPNRESSWTCIRVCSSTSHPFLEHWIPLSR